MLKRFFFVVTLFIIQNTIAQELYSKAYGDPKNIPLLFLHGGPGYNSAGFELTTAQALADNGFYVIAYDRRGEGRSADAHAKFNFSQTFEDVNAVLQKYNIKKVNLLGHSFGGIVATLYTEKYPEKVGSLALVSAPIALQETFKTILSSSKKIYTAKNDTTNLNYIAMIEKMDPTSVEYFAYSFGHAMQNGFYSPKKLSDEAKAIYANASKNSDFKYAAQMTNEAPIGFLKNENYTSIDLTQTLKKLVAAKTRIYGLYGTEDGLYAPEQVEKLGEIIGQDRLKYWGNCSHNVFIDQQQKFISFFKSNVK